jgi:pilus assembly protein CpaB
MKEKLVPIVSVVVGLLAFGLTWKYLHDNDKALQAELQRIYRGAQQIKVMVTTSDIPKGTVLKRQDLDRRPEYMRIVGDRAVMHKDGLSLLGKKTTRSLDKGEWIAWSDIEGGVSAVHGLAPIIKPGMRAISLSVGGASAVSGMVQPDNRVDVLGTFSFPSKTEPGQMETVTITVLQDVTILATGQKLAKTREAKQRYSRSGSYSTVTVEVTPREAELLVFAQQTQGRLTLSLRNTDDGTYESNLPDVNFNHLQNSLKELNTFRQKNIRYKRNVR